MIKHYLTLTIDLTDTAWQSDWNGYEVGFPEAEVVGLYAQARDDGTYYFYIDMGEGKVLDFWKEDTED